MTISQTKCSWIWKEGGLDRQKKGETLNNSVLTRTSLSLTKVRDSALAMAVIFRWNTGILLYSYVLSSLGLNLRQQEKLQTSPPRK